MKSKTPKQWNLGSGNVWVFYSQALKQIYMCLGQLSIGMQMKFP